MSKMLRNWPAFKKSISFHSRGKGSSSHSRGNSSHSRDNSKREETSSIDEKANDSIHTKEHEALPNVVSANHTIEHVVNNDDSRKEDIDDSSRSNSNRGETASDVKRKRKKKTNDKSRKTSSSSKGTGPTKKTSAGSVAKPSNLESRLSVDENTEERVTEEKLPAKLKKEKKKSKRKSIDGSKDALGAVVQGDEGDSLKRKTVENEVERDDLASTGTSKKSAKKKKKARKKNKQNKAINDCSASGKVEDSNEKDVVIRDLRKKLKAKNKEIKTLTGSLDSLTQKYYAMEEMIQRSSSGKSFDTSLGGKKNTSMKVDTGRQEIVKSDVADSAVGNDQKDLNPSSLNLVSSTALGASKGTVGEIDDEDSPIKDQADGSLSSCSLEKYSSLGQTRKSDDTFSDASFDGGYESDKENSDGSSPQPSNHVNQIQDQDVKADLSSDFSEDEVSLNDNELFGSSTTSNTPTEKKGNTKISRDDISLDEDDLFDPVPSGPPPRKPILEAALTAKSTSYLNSLHNKRSRSTSSVVANDAVSLDSDDLFDLEPRAPPREKKFLDAALKAKSLSDLKYCNADDVSLEDDVLFELPTRNPPPKKQFLEAALKAKSLSAINYFHDDDSSLEGNELFELTPREPRPKKRFLEAALKAKSMSNLNFDYDSLGEDELFDPRPRKSRPRKPLLEAALKAKSMSDFNYVHVQDNESRDDAPSDAIPDHLIHLNQPRSSSASDVQSIDADDLFERNEEDFKNDRPVPKAAMNAKVKESEDVVVFNKKEISIQKIVPEHLVVVNQPSSALPEDNYSIDQDDLFEFVLEEKPSNKPLLAAALRAHAEREEIMSKSFSHFQTHVVRLKECDSYEELSKSVPDHLASAYQPDRPSSRYDELSIDDDRLFDSPKPMPKKPLLTAALKAKEDTKAKINVHFHGERRRESESRTRNGEDIADSYSHDSYEAIDDDDLDSADLDDSDDSVNFKRETFASNDDVNDYIDELECRKRVYSES